MARLAESDMPFLKAELGLNSGVGLELPKIPRVAFRPNPLLRLDAILWR